MLFLGNRSQITSSLGTKIDVARNEMGNVSQITASRSQQAQWTAPMQYNELGQEIKNNVDDVGNLYETKEKADRVYGAGSRLLETREATFASTKGRLIDRQAIIDNAKKGCRK